MSPSSSPSNGDGVPFHDLDRLALAVDALSVGGPWPVLVHVQVAPHRRRGCEPRPRSELGLEPLVDDDPEVGTLELLERCVALPTWTVVGLSTPIRLSALHASHRDPTGVASAQGWLVHVIDRLGRHASRVWSPDDPRVSGSVVDSLPGGAVDRGLRRVLGLGER